MNMVSKKHYTPKGFKRKGYTLTPKTIKVLKAAQVAGGYAREGDLFEDLVSSDAKKRCKAQKAVLKARKSL